MKWAYGDYSLMVRGSVFDRHAGLQDNMMKIVISHLECIPKVVFSGDWIIYKIFRVSL